MSKKDIQTIIWLLGIIALVAHAVVIADDVLAVVNDPNQANKPGEVLKLAVDVSRYFG